MILYNAAHNHARFRHFVAAFTRLVESAHNNEACIHADGEKLLLDLVRNDDGLPDDYAQPHPQYYQQ